MYFQRLQHQLLKIQEFGNTCVDTARSHFPHRPTRKIMREFILERNLTVVRSVGNHLIGKETGRHT